MHNQKIQFGLIKKTMINGLIFLILGFSKIEIGKTKVPKKKKIYLYLCIW
jgi:hypothetical protein